MSNETNSYIAMNNNECPLKVVSIPVSLFESIQGRYFVGQTEDLWPGNGFNAWAGLANPCDSHVDLYANVFTVSNFSDEYLTAEIWLNAEFPRKTHVSRKASPTNTSLSPLPENKVDIRFLKSTTLEPETGVNVYERIVPPHTTLVGEEDGKFIESQGGTYVVVVKSPGSEFSKVIVAFGWWEKPRH